MSTENFISLNQLSSHYKVEFSFFNELSESGLIKISTIEQSQYVHIDNLKVLEKIIRIHHELDINIEGIDTVLNLLKRIEDLQNEINSARNRLSLYENDLAI